MATNYVLIDFENVRPKNLELLSRHPFKVLVFVGASQTKIPFELAEAIPFNRVGPSKPFDLTCDCS